jgi:hypothetical protein
VDTSRRADIAKIIVMVDLPYRPELTCSPLPGDSPLAGNNHGVISCAQSVPGLNLKAIVNFDLNVSPPYDMRMRSALDYLINEVFDCESFNKRGNA